MNKKIWSITEGKSPIIATAIHSGHAVRDDVAEMLALTESERLREEDPYTDKWTTITDNQIVGLQSRFEFDLNRPREKAVYLKPEDAWGLHVWKRKPSPQFIENSLKHYDAFYSEVYNFLKKVVNQHRFFVVLDLHSYNHYRNGLDKPADDPQLSPELNIGTGTMDRNRWASIVDRFMADLKHFNFLGRNLDVRENVKFKGGYFPCWIHENFPDSGCVLSVEIKKIFMNEWTGVPDEEQIAVIRKMLEYTIPGIIKELSKLVRIH